MLNYYSKVGMCHKGQNKLALIYYIWEYSHVQRPYFINLFQVKMS